MKRFIFILMVILLVIVVLGISIPLYAGAATVTGGVIKYGAGEHWLDDTIILDTASILEGDGKRLTVLHPSVGKNAIEIVGSETQVRNLEISGNDTDVGILINKSAYKVKIENVAIKHFNEGIRNEGAHSVTIDNYYGAYNVSYDINLLTDAGWEPNANRILNSTIHSAYVQGGETVLFSGVVFEGAEYGLVVEPYDNYSSVTVIASHFEQAPFWLKGKNTRIINSFGTDGDFIIEGDSNTLEGFTYSGSATLTIQGSQNSIIDIYPYSGARFTDNGSYTYMRRGAIIYTKTYIAADLSLDWHTLSGARLYGINNDYDTSEWGIAEQGRFWLNKTEGVIKYWDGTQLKTIAILEDKGGASHKGRD